MPELHPATKPECLHIIATEKICYINASEIARSEGDFYGRVFGWRSEERAYRHRIGRIDVALENAHVFRMKVSIWNRG